MSEEFLEAQDRARESAREDRAEELRALALRIAEDRASNLVVAAQQQAVRAAANRAAAKLRERRVGEMAYYRGPQLGADDDLPREHFAQVGNFMGTRDDYLYPEDYGTRDIDRGGVAPVGGWVATLEQVRRRGTVDGRPGSKAIK